MTQRQTPTHGVYLSYRNSVLRNMQDEEYEEVTRVQLKALLSMLRKKRDTDNWKYDK
jgi:hypothetical protein